VTSPCRSFQVAYNHTNARGEIDVLDPGGYGALTITKSISIQGHGYSGISLAAQGAAITINVGANDTVSLRGLLLDGTSFGSSGVAFNTGGIVNIQDCAIRAFGQGLNLVAPGGRVYVANSVLADNGDGVFVGEAPNIHVTLARVEILGSLGRGLFAQGINLGSRVPMLIAVNDSTIAGSASYGIWAVSSGFQTQVGSFVTVVVARSSIVNGANSAIATDGTGAVVQLYGSMVALNAGGVSTSGGGAVTSWGNNGFSDVGGSGDGALQLLTLQ
jgi:hypothetical protein